MEKNRSSKRSPSVKRLAMRYGALFALIALPGLPVAPVGVAQTVRATTYGTTIGTTPGSIRLAAGLQVTVKITQGLTSKSATEGEEWDGVLAKDLIVGGHLMTPSGTQVTGVVSKSISAARALGNGTLGVRLTSIHGTGISSEEILRLGLNPALTNTGNAAAAGIPGEAAQSTPPTTPTAGATPTMTGRTTPQTLAEARIAPGAILNFTTE